MWFPLSIQWKGMGRNLFHNPNNQYLTKVTKDKVRSDGPDKFDTHVKILINLLIYKTLISKMRNKAWIRTRLRVRARIKLDMREK